MWQITLLKWMVLIVGILEFNKGYGVPLKNAHQVSLDLLELAQAQFEDEPVLELEHLKHPKPIPIVDLPETSKTFVHDIAPHLYSPLAGVNHVQSVEPSGNRHDDEDGDSATPFEVAKTAEDGTPYIQQMPDFEAHAESTKPKAHLYPGAARLTLGQNPEIETTTEQQPPPMSSTTTTSLPANKEIVPEITENGQKRQAAIDEQKNEQTLQNLLRQSNGQLSAFDMAQYVFWKGGGGGEEESVARTVEEFIREGLMSRETAIKFLRDIRVGIDYLQNKYSTRPDNSGNRQFVQQEYNNVMHPVVTQVRTSTISTPVSTPPQQPPSVANERQSEEKPLMSVDLQKSVAQSLASIKNNEISDNKVDEKQTAYDELTGRLRLADFLYAEYSLEEVIYQLAKVMFSQSLTHGSEPAQTALQRLTGFLESEGVNGRISPALQKKVLDVLLAALSDTLAENPELLSTGRPASIASGSVNNDAVQTNGQKQ